MWRGHRGALKGSAAPRINRSREDVNLITSHLELTRLVGEESRDSERQSNLIHVIQQSGQWGVLKPISFDIQAIQPSERLLLGNVAQTVSVCIDRLGISLGESPTQCSWATHSWSTQPSRQFAIWVLLCKRPHGQNHRAWRSPGSHLVMTWKTCRVPSNTCEGYSVKTLKLSPIGASEC